MMIKTADRINSISEYYFSKKLKEIAEMNSYGMNVINLGIGNPDLNPPSNIIDRLKKDITKKGQHKYQSYSGINELREAKALWYKRFFQIDINSQSEILPLIGSKEGIMHLSMTYLQSGDQVLIPDPAYPTYSTAAKLAGAEIKYFNLKPENNWLPDLDELKKNDLSKIKMMWINYPNMPTGKNASLIELEKIVDFCFENQILLCNDNPYIFVLNDNPHSIFQIPKAKDIAIELTSMSKSYNMAGWRIGFMTGHSDRIKDVLKFKSNMDSGMFKPIQLAAIEALNMDSSWFDEINSIYKNRKNVVLSILSDLKCKTSSEQVGLFLWAKIPKGFKNSYHFSDYVLDKSKVFMTPGNIFGNNGNDYIRISLCNDKEMLEEAKRRISLINLKVN